MPSNEFHSFIHFKFSIYQQIIQQKISSFFSFLIYESVRSKKYNYLIIPSLHKDESKILLTRVNCSLEEIQFFSFFKNKLSSKSKFIFISHASLFHYFLSQSQTLFVSFSLNFFCSCLPNFERIKLKI